MKARINETMLKRTISIDFDAYADNDPDFKQELTAIMIDNLQELKRAYSLSVMQNNLDVFLRACHKMKTTLFMLGDAELSAIVEDLKNPLVVPYTVSLFNTLIAQIIAGLLDQKM